MLTKVVVLSGSMEPSIHRGDLLVLTNYAKRQPLVTGDIVVYKLPGRGVPIVHRIIKVHEDERGDVDILSKGDNNIPDDRELYGNDRKWLERDMIVGRSCAFLPYAGMLTILVRFNSSIARIPSP
jgi:signal peptidase I